MTPGVFQTGDDLLRLIDSITVKNGSKLKCYDFVESIVGFCNSDDQDGKIGIVFGLPLTGKTVGMVQAVELLLQQGHRVAYVSLKFCELEAVDDVSAELIELLDSGYTHFFVDEAPYLQKLLTESARLADAFPVKIVATGPDTFKLWYALNLALPDYSVGFSTHCRSFLESKRVLGKGYGEYKAHSGLFIEGQSALGYLKSAIADNLIYSLQEGEDESSEDSKTDYVGEKQSFYEATAVLLHSVAEVMLRKKFLQLTGLTSETSHKGDYKAEYIAENPKSPIEGFMSFFIKVGCLLEIGIGTSDFDLQPSWCFAHPALLSYEVNDSMESIARYEGVDARVIAKDVSKAAYWAINENIVLCHFIWFADKDEQIFIYRDKEDRDVDIVSINRKLEKLRLVEVTGKSKDEVQRGAKVLFAKAILKNIGVSDSFSITRIIAYNGENKCIEHAKGELFLLKVEDLLCRIKDLDAFLSEIRSPYF
jgi:hypothetical protein